MSVQHSTLSLSLSFSLSLPLSVSLYQSFFSPLSLSLSTFEHKIDQSLRKSSETRPTSPWFTQKRPMFPERCSRKSSDSHPKSPTSILFLSLSFPLSFFLSRCFFLSLSLSTCIFVHGYVYIHMYMESAECDESGRMILSVEHVHRSIHLSIYISHLLKRGSHMPNPTF